MPEAGMPIAHALHGSVTRIIRVVLEWQYRCSSCSEGLLRLAVSTSHFPLSSSTELYRTNLRLTASVVWTLKHMPKHVEASVPFSLHLNGNGGSFQALPLLRRKSLFDHQLAPLAVMLVVSMMQPSTLLLLLLSLPMALLLWLPVIIMAKLRLVMRWRGMTWWGQRGRKGRETSAV